MDSVLTSIKKLLGMDEMYTQFDTDIVIHINTALMSLNQLGVIEDVDFYITDKTQTWSDLIGDVKNIEAIKTYVYFKVRLAFDPPTTSFGIEAIERQLFQLEWRLNVQAEEDDDEDG